MATLISCNDKSYNQICDKLKLLSSFVHQYKWIIQSYVSDFYTKDHWSKLPNCVKEFIDETIPPDWAWLLEDGNSGILSSKRPMPLILLAIKAYSQYLTLRRTAVDLDTAETNHNIIDSLQTDHLQTDEPTLITPDNDNGVVKVIAFQPPNYKNGQCMDMHHIFRKHVKPKKQHEIQKLGQVINLLSGITSCKSVIDVGAGLGHLSRLLTFRFGLRVVTVEADDGHAPKASDFDRELRKDVIRKQQKVLKSNVTSDAPGNCSDQNVDVVPQTETEREIELTVKEIPTLRDDVRGESSMFHSSEDELPNHVVCRINHENASSQLTEIIHQNKLQDVSVDDNNFILTGLHACGDLSPSLLRIFLECPSAVGLASVACCYMKLEQFSTNPSSTKLALENYPMSDLLKKIPNHELDYESREMACHFIEAYCQRLKDNPVHLKIHSYRAALQYMVTTVQPSFQSGQVRLITKKGAQRSFLDYASETLKKLNIEVSDVPQELVYECEEMTKDWKRVVAFYTIRLSLAPIVEALILLDRLVYLKEKGVNSALVPIFDSKMSPRNFVILAVKS